MSIFNINGNYLTNAYETDGDALPVAYDINGNVIFSPDWTRIKVMSYNIGQWYIGNGSNVPTDKYTSYYNLQRSILSSNAPDVVGFQEYYDPFSTGHNVADVIGEYFTDHVNNATSGYPAKAIYTNGYDISDYSVHDFSVGNQLFIVGKIVVDGKDIWIINVHLATSLYEANKVAQSVELFNYVSNLEYFIILGDFNTVCKSVNDSEYTTIMKQFVDAGYNIANCSAQHGFIDTWTEGTSESGTWYPTDHIITSPNIIMADVYRDTTKLTDGLSDVIDHLPLVAELIVT